MRSPFNQKFKLQVSKEAHNLLKYATLEELARLDISTLDGSHSALCVYGQLTGSCFGERASELLALCAPAYAIDLNDISEMVTLRKGEEFSRATGLDEDTIYCFSPIEVFLILTKSYEQLRVNLIDFLQLKASSLII